MNSSQVPGDISAADLERICRSALRSTFPSLRTRKIRASFYPYIGLTHTIRRCGAEWVLRISDHCRKAPREVLAAIAIILGCKVFRQQPSDDWLRIYEQFRRDPAVEAMVRARRIRRGKKIMRTTGKYHDLRLYYRQINRQYFNSQIDLNAIGWSERRSWTRLGHFDPIHRTITISPVLDSRELPRKVLKYLVYHELLHAVFEEESRGARKNYHFQSFREAERAYPDYAAAKKLLNEFCRSRGTKRG